MRLLLDLPMDGGIEGFSIDRMKANFLTEANWRELVTLTDEQIGQVKEQYEERLAVVDGQVKDVRRGLHIVYDALETGTLDGEDLAPRIRGLKAEMNDLERNRVDLMKCIWKALGSLLAGSVVRAYVDDLRGAKTLRPLLREANRGAPAAGGRQQHSAPQKAKGRTSAERSSTFCI